MGVSRWPNQDTWPPKPSIRVAQESVEKYLHMGVGPTEISTDVVLPSNV